jgi:hypothetical protein
MNVAGCKQYLGHLDYFRTLNREAGVHADPDTCGRVVFTFGRQSQFPPRNLVGGASPQAPPPYPALGTSTTTEIDLRLRELGAHILYTPGLGSPTPTT